MAVIKISAQRRKVALWTPCQTDPCQKKNLFENRGDALNLDEERLEEGKKLKVRRERGSSSIYQTQVRFAFVGEGR